MSVKHEHGTVAPKAGSQRFRDFVGRFLRRNKTEAESGEDAFARGVVDLNGHSYEVKHHAASADSYIDELQVLMPPKGGITVFEEGYTLPGRKQRRALVTCDSPMLESHEPNLRSYIVYLEDDGRRTILEAKAPKDVRAFSSDGLPGTMAFSAGSSLSIFSPVEPENTQPADVPESVVNLPPGVATHLALASQVLARR